MSYTIQELTEIIEDLGLTDAIREISSDSILDPTMKDLWEEAKVSIEKIDDFLNMEFSSSDDDDDIEWDDDDEESYD